MNIHIKEPTGEGMYNRWVQEPVGEVLEWMACI